MKKIIIALMFMLMISTVYSLSIDNCKSGYSNWECEQGKVCTCTISRGCTNGNLLVYKNSIIDFLCAPAVVGSNARIYWDRCDDPSEEVKVRVLCDEGQSSEEEIIISISETTTTTRRTTTTTFPRTTTTRRVTTTTERATTTTIDEEHGSGGSKLLVGFGIIVIIIVGGVLLFLKMKSKKKVPKTRRPSWY